ncbi:MAG: guanylate kinase [Lachnospiraceae bacterium]|nr:guanylate kinase [Lachnospiraceae bacterium]
MKGLLTVISGFSGVGKGTLVRELLSRYPDQYVLSISATSRAPRTGEQEGVHYFYKTREEFMELIRQDAFLEYANYNGNFYGTPRKFVEEQLAAGKNVILEIEVQGGFQIKARFPEAVLLYVIPPSAEELVKRLKNRNTETNEEIRRRLERAVIEADAITQYDYVVINDDFETCLNEMHETIKTKQASIDKRRAYADALRNELIKITEQE